MAAIPGENSDNSLNNNENNEKRLRKSDFQSFDYTEKNVSPGTAKLMVSELRDMYIIIS